MPIIFVFWLVCVFRMDHDSTVRALLLGDNARIRSTAELVERKQHSEIGCKMISSIVLTYQGMILKAEQSVDFGLTLVIYLT